MFNVYNFIFAIILLDIFINLNEIQHKEKADLVYWLIIIFTTLELLNIGISPLLYGWMDKNFRSELLVYFKANKNKIFRKQPLIGY